MFTVAAPKDTTWMYNWKLGKRHESASQNRVNNPKRKENIWHIHNESPPCGEAIRTEGR